MLAEEMESVKLEKSFFMVVCPIIFVKMHAWVVKGKQFQNTGGLMSRIGAVSVPVLLAVGALNSMSVWGEDSAKPAFRWGADERIREEYFDNIPIKTDPPGVTRGGDNNYFRFRTRVWSEYEPVQSVTLRLRVVNEFREWDRPEKSPTAQKLSYAFPDEAVFDALSVEIRDLLNDKLDLKVGRQDLIYGTGKVILEGTPKDGSRTIYFNAAKATWKGVQDTTIDLIGIYNPYKDDLAIDTADRDLTGLTSNNDKMDESGVVVYLKNKSATKFPYELYGIFKRESAWSQPAKKDSSGAYIQPAYAWQSLDLTDGRVDNPELDLGAAGFRLLPEFAERLKGNLELAYQFGSRGATDVTAYGIDAFLTYAVPTLQEMKPSVDYGIYHLSGDDPKTDKDEGWNPLWARYPQNSELYAYALDADGAGRWSNLSMPHAGVSISPVKWLKTSVMVGYLFAPESDGPGGGDERGLLCTLKNEFTAGENLLMHKDKLAGHLLLEVLEPGNYYKVNDTAAFARWELSYSF
jgi:hypothetical protein